MAELRLDRLDARALGDEQAGAGVPEVLEPQPLRQRRRALILGQLGGRLVRGRDAAASGRGEQEASFFTVVVWRDQAEHAAESLAKGSRVVVVGRLQQRSWTAEDGSARSTVEVVADELGASLRWATATTRTTRSQNR
jgi:hypothetical protein